MNWHVESVGTDREAQKTEIVKAFGVATAPPGVIDSTLAALATFPPGRPLEVHAEGGVDEQGRGTLSLLVFTVENPENDPKTSYQPSQEDKEKLAEVLGKVPDEIRAVLIQLPPSPAKPEEVKPLEQEQK